MRSAGSSAASHCPASMALARRRRSESSSLAGTARRATLWARRRVNRKIRRKGWIMRTSTPEAAEGGRDERRSATAGSAGGQPLLLLDGALAFDAVPGEG